MCGRYSLAVSAEDLVALFGFGSLDGLEVTIEGARVALELALEPRYNIAPTQPVLACRADSERPQPELAQLRWGITPRWRDGAPLINARAETVASKPSFREAFASRRCLIAADGFYEWSRRGDAPAKQPHRFSREDGKPLAFAGVWSRVTRGDRIVDEAAIITVPANAVVSPFHDRMPAIVPTRAVTRWLGADPDAARALLTPAPEDLLTCYAVHPRVGKVDQDDRRLHRRWDPDDLSDLPLFAD